MMDPQEMAQIIIQGPEQDSSDCWVSHQDLRGIPPPAASRDTPVAGDRARVPSVNTVSKDIFSKSITSVSLTKSGPPIDQDFTRWGVAVHFCCQPGFLAAVAPSGKRRKNYCHNPPRPPPKAGRHLHSEE